MTTTLKAIRDRMYVMDPSVGRSLSIASLTTTTIVVSALATGTVDASRYVQKWLRRRDTATAADLIRLCSHYASSTGTLTHAGANYSDTTATSETVEITEFEPFLIDNAVLQALRKQKRIDRTIIPTVHSVDRYWLHDLTWVDSPSQIRKVCYRPSRVLSKNRYFDKWNAYSTAGALTPDHWTTAGASATFARSTTQVDRGQYSLAITRSGTNATATQTVGLLTSGVSGEDLRGETVTVVVRGWSDTASALRVQLLDGVTTTSSDYHTGGSVWEELTASATIGATATTVQVRVTVDADSTAYAGDCYALWGSLDDTERYDSTREQDITEMVAFDQGNGTLSMRVPRKGRGAQFVIYSERGYPELDATRFAAGTADADVIDAPMVMTATGGLAHLYEGQARRRGEDTTKMQYMGVQWMEQWERMALAHRYNDDIQGGGVQLPRPGVPIVSGRYR